MFPSLYRQTIYYRPQLEDTDGRGMKTFGEPITIKARVEPTTRLIRNRDGEQVAASAQIFFAPTHSVHETGLFYLPDFGGDPERTETGVQAVSISLHRHLINGAPSHIQVFI